MLVRIVERISQMAIWTCWQIGQVGCWLRCIFRNLYSDLFNHFTLILFSLPFFHRFSSFDGSPESKRLAIAIRQHHANIFHNLLSMRSLSNFIHNANCLLDTKTYSFCWQLALGLQEKCEMFKVTAAVSIDYNQIEIPFANHVAISLWSDSFGACNIIPR